LNEAEARPEPPVPVTVADPAFALVGTLAIDDVPDAARVRARLGRATV
jgi:hypothetical protein